VNEPNLARATNPTSGEIYETLRANYLKPSLENRQPKHSRKLFDKAQ
jgi:hypothetical protein